MKEKHTTARDVCLGPLLLPFVLPAHGSGRGVQVGRGGPGGGYYGGRRCHLSSPAHGNGHGVGGGCG